MRIILISLTFLLSSVIWAYAHSCARVIDECYETEAWTRCYEDRIGSCIVRGRSLGFFRDDVNSSEVAKVGIFGHDVHIPSAALKMSRGLATEEKVKLVVTRLNSTYFKPIRRVGRRKIVPPQPAQSGFILGEMVLVVRAGNVPVKNLLQPVKLTFKHNKLVQNGVCVFWQESDMEDVPGNWSTEGCETAISGTDYVCSCNHLSFFAVLVNPILTVDKKSAERISYINFIGSALSVFFTAVTLVIYIFLQRRRPEKAIGVHIQLTLALFCLHLVYLLSSLLVSDDGRVCKALGLLLHWSLLSTFTWTALEGFHLYLLLVRVFNIYVRRYLLKLSLVGWGIPTLVVMVCGILGVYGRYIANFSDNTPSLRSSPEFIGQICWVSSQFPQNLVVIFITIVAFPCLVILCNSCMLGLVVFQLWGLRKGDGVFGSNGSWKKIDRQRRTRLWKDAATVLGLSCVLGLPWGLATMTYVKFDALPGVYIFTVFNSLQGVFMFLWCLALSCKPQSENNSSVRDPSTQKMMDTSFNT